MLDLLVGATLETKLENLDRILNVLAAFHYVSNTYGEYSHEAVAEAFSKFDIQYTDILKARMNVEVVRERLLAKSNNEVAA